MSTEHLSTLSCFSISFNNACRFQYIGPSHPLLSLFLVILFFLSPLKKELFFSISFSEISLLVYRNAVNFCALIVHPATLPWLFLTGVFPEVFRVFYIKNHVICKKWQFHFFIPSLDAFYFFLFPDCSGLDFQYYAE